MVTKVKGGVLDESALSGKNMTGDIAFDSMSPTELINPSGPTYNPVSG